DPRASPGMKTTLADAMMSAMFGALASTFLPKIGLDVFKFGLATPESRRSANPAAVAAQNAYDSGMQTRVEVGKYIGKRMYLSYERIFGAQAGTNSNEARLEYHVTPRLTLQSLFGDAGVGGLDLFWTYRY